MPVNNTSENLKLIQLLLNTLQNEAPETVDSVNRMMSIIVEYPDRNIKFDIQHIPKEPEKSSFIKFIISMIASLLLLVVKKVGKYSYHGILYLNKSMPAIIRILKDTPEYFKSNFFRTLVTARESSGFKTPLWSNVSADFKTPIENLALQIQIPDSILALAVETGEISPEQQYYDVVESALSDLNQIPIVSVVDTPVSPTFVELQPTSSGDTSITITSNKTRKQRCPRGSRRNKSTGKCQKSIRKRRSSRQKSK